MMMAALNQTNWTEAPANWKPDEQLLVGLSRFQKTLLSTGDTVTELLEHYVGEPIKVLKLHERIENRISQLPSTHRILVDSNNTPVLAREILLQGQQTLNNWIYAKSTILLNHISQEFRLDLVGSREPIGKLWEKYGIKNSKAFLTAEREEARALATHFNIRADDEMLSRTYCVHTDDKVTMVITEKFPTCFFCEE